MMEQERKSFLSCFFILCALDMSVISSFLFFFAEKFRHVNLIIEQGNTSSKVAVYNKRHMEASFVFKKFDVEVISSIFKKYPLTKGIFSTVIDKDDELVAYLESNLRNFVFLDETVSLPIKVQYKTPETLGRTGWLPLSELITCNPERICW